MDNTTIQKGHRYFAAEAFNRCWELIRLESRTAEQDREMIRRAEVSFWHWQAYEDRTPTNDAIGYWQLARVYTLAQAPEIAIEYALSGLEIVRTHQLDSFYAGYAWESLARAYSVANRMDDCYESIKEARIAADLVTAPDHQSALIADIDTIRIVEQSGGGNSAALRASP